MIEDIIRKIAILNVDQYISEKDKKQLEEAIERLGIDITPEEIFSASVTISLISVFLSSISFVIFGSLAFTVLFIVLGLIAFFFLKNYPIYLLKVREEEESKELLLMVFFVVIYMRMNPNLEKALEFAAQNLVGPLGKKLKKLLWDLENRVYSSAIEALDYFSREWRGKVPEFIDAVRLIEASLYETSEERRLNLLDRAIERILDGAYERANKYVILLKQPLNAIYMLGIVLPVLITVMIPVIAIFSGQSIGLDTIFVFYDVLLPVIILIFSMRVLKKRPVLYQRAVPYHPNWPKRWNILLFGREVNIFLIIGILTLLFEIGPMIYYVLTFPGYPNTMDLYISFFPVLFFVLSLSLILKEYYNQRKVEIEEIERAERDFVDISFQIGNRIAEGYPAEAAILKVSEQINIRSSFFNLLVDRIRRMGLSLTDACFHPQYGIFRMYKSPILFSGMRILIEGIKKSFREAASAIINFSRHLRNMEKIELRIADLLGEITSEMRFNISYILPILLSIVVGITALLLVVLFHVKEQVQLVFQYSEGIESQFGSGFLMGLLSVAQSFPLPVFQLILSLYFVSTVGIASYLISQVEKPGAEYYYFKLFSEILMLAGLIYFLVGLTSSFAFISLAKVALRFGEIA